jgi:hypothetical protein
MKTNATFLVSVFSSVLLVCSLINFDAEYANIDSINISTHSAIAKQKQDQYPNTEHSVIPVNAILTKNELKKKR